tara:strand:+ start:490 stop:687 length:198 start_codon:yes stop_codon:yes gene_type:complete
MSYKETITATFNKALIKKLRKDVRSASKSETKLHSANVEFTKKRRHAEDIALAKELGVTIEELLE